MTFEKNKLYKLSLKNAEELNKKLGKYGFYSDGFGVETFKSGVSMYTIADSFEFLGNGIGMTLYIHDIANSKSLIETGHITWGDTLNAHKTTVTKRKTTARKTKRA